jgi:hypothetical protein
VLARKLRDEQLPAQNTPFCATTGENPADAEFIHIGGYVRASTMDSSHTK